jgi:hypothetical protein
MRLAVFAAVIALLSIVIGAGYLLRDRRRFGERHVLHVVADVAP